MNKNEWFKRIPKVDILLETEEIENLIESYGRTSVLSGIREEMDILRKQISQCETEEDAIQRIEELVDKIQEGVEKKHTPNMELVINGTGTVLHTNLGRAPISKKHMERLALIASGYGNLEYNLKEGRRGERYSHFEELLCEITGAEAAMAVNNNASSVLLILNTLAKGGEAIVSRGELIEIGGKFRIPDVMEASGAVMVEVGTTNKTHLEDYEKAITEETKAILKVHTSNYQVVGFTESVSMEELSAISNERDIPLVEDLGSGVLIDLSKYGLTYEPRVQDSIEKGADVVCFSGDKLLGGPQAGIIIGKKKYIDQMKKNQLTRALRIDKFTATALELTLLEYLSEENVVKNIPVLEMITMPYEVVEKKAKKLLRELKKQNMPGDYKLCGCESQIGGGSLPLERLKSAGVSIASEGISAAEIETRLRKLPIPIIVRIVNDEILIDVRCIEEKNMQMIAKMLKENRVFESVS
ncbi:L-seryl-tRNA(Sec) selenium transferase [Aequitasia blattaphilus]|uniref:L-seryl-tRNA(Sec) selenium transferase n=1 Tax=Aequitasia blattaphilus TaxID=2949332 RepID=A0ABT1ED45_9FIRM|nr:L-seryl-tRNA(Sec) selenium transferase [Aequitasia blattaphilus]MCP1102887.1 L-seryl-tRNA(Sec) selenium transferase [Aequitasia blattaphilus]MCR8615527.1 L-seryl-tRNA(Sec) selenium transferase [Aequitasia blattaphilus]